MVGKDRQAAAAAAADALSGRPAAGAAAAGLPGTAPEEEKSMCLWLGSLCLVEFKRNLQFWGLPYLETNTCVWAVQGQSARSLPGVPKDFFLTAKLYMYIVTYSRYLCVFVCLYLYVERERERVTCIGTGNMIHTYCGWTTSYSALSSSEDRTIRTFEHFGAWQAQNAERSLNCARTTKFSLQSS